MNILSLERVSVAYSAAEFCVENINLSLERGKTLVVYGREGSGKTLILRSVAGLEECLFGDIILGGKDLKDIDVKDRDIGFSFDFSSLDKKKTVRQTVEYPMRLRGYDGEQIAKRVANALGNFSLCGDDRVGSLDGFGKAKLILARLFAIERRLYIVDDIWKDLDGERQNDIIDILERIAVGKSAVVATQDIEIARRLCRGGVIATASKGECTAALPLDMHSKRPVNMETAILCGYEIYSGVLQKTGNEYFAEIDKEEYKVERPLCDIYVGKEVCFAYSKDSGAAGFYYDRDCERIVSLQDKI